MCSMLTRAEAGPIWGDHSGIIPTGHGDHCWHMLAPRGWETLHPIRQVNQKLLTWHGFPLLQGLVFWFGETRWANPRSLGGQSRYVLWGLVGRKRQAIHTENLEHGWVKTIVGMFTGLNVNDPLASNSHVTISPNHMHPHLFFAARLSWATNLSHSRWRHKCTLVICRQVYSIVWSGCLRTMFATPHAQGQCCSSLQWQNMFLKTCKNIQQAPQVTGSKQCPNQTWTIALSPTPVHEFLARNSSAIASLRSRFWLWGGALCDWTSS